MKTGKANKTLKGKDTRDRILLAARKLLVESGSANVTMEKIGERAGVANCSVVWHFGSKENLFLEIFDNVVDEFENAFGSYEFPAGDPMDMLRRFLSDYADLMKVFAELHVIFFSYVFNGKIGGKNGDRIRVMYDGYRCKMAERIRNFIPVDSEYVASALIALIDGTFIQWHVDPDHVDIQKVFEAFLSIVSVKAER
jgi:AcrR family transcriptional regulator